MAVNRAAGATATNQYFQAVAKTCLA